MVHFLLQTPSSPARLVTGVEDEEEEDGETADMATDSSCSSLMSGVSSNPSISSIRMQQPIQGVKSPATSSEISLDDHAKPGTSALNRSGLRRGKPNTMRSGLPSPAKRRSMDQSNITANTLVQSDEEEDSDDDDDTRHASQHIMQSALDTSPIQKVDDHIDRYHPQDDDDDQEVEEEEEETMDISHSAEEEEESSEVEEEADDNELEMALTRQTSTTSVTSTTEGDHDQAFIHESLLADLEGSPKDKEDEVDEEGFKKPMGIPKTSTTQLLSSDHTKSMSGQGVSKSDSSLNAAKSSESIDSGIESEDGKLSKSVSLQSISSTDSGDNPKGLTSVSFKRQPSIRARPNLQLSSDTQNILARAGIQPEEESDASNEAAKKECLERRQSSLRFPNSRSRKRGVSPVRIPTIFAKADQEAAQKYRDLATAAVARPHSPNRSRKPNLPIGTDLVNAKSVQNAKNRLMLPKVSDDQLTPTDQQIKSSKAGHTPMFVLGQKSSLSMRDRENSPETETSSATIATPKIKPMLMATDVTKRVLSVVPPNSTASPAPRKTTRSPIKPVKRLQGSPKSPNPRNSKYSPGKAKNSGSGNTERLSPLPKHLSDAEWDV